MSYTPERENPAPLSDERDGVTHHCKGDSPFSLSLLIPWQDEIRILLIHLRFDTEEDETSSALLRIKACLENHKLKREKCLKLEPPPPHLWLSRRADWGGEEEN